MPTITKKFNVVDELPIDVLEIPQKKRNYTEMFEEIKVRKNRRARRRLC